MDTMERMLASHPARPTTHFDAVTDCIAACMECAQVCTLCADACLSEAEALQLRQCVRLDLDCADLCLAMGRIVARQATPDARLWRLSLEACAEACRACATECGHHEDRFAHCRWCREACERCERACLELLAACPNGGTLSATH